MNPTGSGECIRSFEPSLSPPAARPPRPRFASRCTCRPRSAGGLARRMRQAGIGSLIAASSSRGGRVGRGHQGELRRLQHSQPGGRGAGAPVAARVAADRWRAAPLQVESSDAKAPLVDAYTSDSFLLRRHADVRPGAPPGAARGDRAAPLLELHGARRTRTRSDR